MCIEKFKSGIPTVNHVQFCSVQCANCTKESVTLELDANQDPARSCDTSISGNATDFDKISPTFTNTSIPGCFKDPLFSIKSAKVEWTGTGSWTPNQICVDFDPDNLGASICTFNQIALNNGESASSTSCVLNFSMKKCNFDATTCP